MSRRRKKKPYVSKWENDAVLITSTVISFEYQNKEIGDRTKNVLYLKSKSYPKTGRLCVLWGRCNARVGDEVMCKGRINEQGTFLIWSLMITKRAEQSEV